MILKFDQIYQKNTKDFEDLHKKHKDFVSKLKQENKDKVKLI
jgi:hypothetical protein